MHAVLFFFQWGTTWSHLDHSVTMVEALVVFQSIWWGKYRASHPTGGSENRLAEALTLPAGHCCISQTDPYSSNAEIRPNGQIAKTGLKTWNIIIVQFA